MQMESHKRLMSLAQDPSSNNPEVLCKRFSGKSARELFSNLIGEVIAADQREKSKLIFVSAIVVSCRNMAQVSAKVICILHHNQRQPTSAANSIVSQACLARLTTKAFAM
jgi:hypothetical protein